MKQCTDCQETKPFSEFHKTRNNKYEGRCKPCRSEYRKGQREVTARYRLNYYYKLSPEKYNQMWQEQGEKCKLCRSPETARCWNIDHDHRCCPDKVTCGNCIRGILCNRCNTLIGKTETLGLDSILAYVDTRV